MNAIGIDTLPVAGRNIFLRLDLDVPFEKVDEASQTGGMRVLDSSRLEASIPTIKKLLEGEPQALIIGGHIGRFGEGQKSISTSFLEPILSELIGKPVAFCPGFTLPERQDTNIYLLENLRATAKEEANDQEFARMLSDMAQGYVNEAFAASHREHASIVTLPKLLPHAIGLRFQEELMQLDKILTNPKKPVVFVLSGVKEDKKEYIPYFQNIADNILVGGRLPAFLEDVTYPKTIIGKLTPEKEDITIHTMEVFENIISTAGTIVVNGPLGKFEEIGHRLGTERVFKAITQSSAFKIAGGGDTINAIKVLNLMDKFDWISVGGGAMLDYLAHGTLPGIEALR